MGKKSLTRSTKLGPINGNVKNVTEHFQNFRILRDIKMRITHISR